MANTQSFNDHVLVDFDKLVIGDLNEINLLENEFETNGWCFIRLPDQNDKLDEVQRTLSTFFNQDQSIKSEYKSSNAFGYSRVGHKEGIRILINQDGLQNVHHPLSNDVEQILKFLSKQCYYLTNILKSIILKMSILSSSPSKDAVSLSPLSMLDIVHYFNERTGPVQQPKVGLNTNEVNCVPHFDPGLFSLSILSTCDGLQLNDRLLNKWIDGPNNSKDDQRSIGVIWLGEAASILTQDRFKTGIHRVVYPRIKHQSRITIWQEICTQSQIESLIPNNQKSIVIPDNTEIQLVNQTNSIPLHVQSGGETLNHFLNRVEDERGIPMSKSGEHYVKRFDSSNLNVLPGDASVTMTNQPNSQPFLVLSRGETLKNFMSRVEDERGIPMSKSGIEHIQIKFPTKGNKKRSFFSKLFKK